MRREVPTIRPYVPKLRGDAEWFAQSVEYYIACPELAEGDNDAAQSGTIGSGQETWMQTTVVGPGNVSFYYKMSSVSGDALAFYVDEDLKASWSQGSSWPWTGNFAVPSGTHTLKWKYYKYSGSTAGSAWVDAIQWSGGVPESGGGAGWEQITYTYDPSGRRIAKDVDGVVTRYVYDGDQCIAEYDANDVLLRKYIHGPCIDQPICMIEAAGGYAGTYFYHYDGLGSVVALSDADGDTVQVYEYDVYGQVAASDPNHPNRFMFTGREFDTETGLYYYRARYYNPTIGRFLQTDPIDYGDGMNVYAYGGNNPVCLVDPSGQSSICSHIVQAGNAFIVAALGVLGASGNTLAGWEEALTLFSEWVNGTGPDVYILGRGSALVEELIGTEPIAAARQMFISANAGLPFIEQWTRISYPYSFGPSEVARAGLNPALQFLGSFTVVITPRQTEDGEETITITNFVTWSSYWRWLSYFGFPVPSSWTRSTFSMCGAMTTILTWSEPILPVTARSEWMGLFKDGVHWRQFNMYPQDEFTPGIAYHPKVGYVAVDISRFYPNENYP